MGVPRSYNRQLCDEIQAFIDSPLCKTNNDTRKRFKINDVKLKELQAKGLLKLKPTASKTTVSRMGNEAHRIKKSLKREAANGQRKSPKALFGRGTGSDRYYSESFN